MQSSAPNQRTESHYRARTRGGNLILYWVCRSVIETVLFAYFRLDKIGREHIPRTGAAIIASNHRSFMDPWVIGTMARRPIYYVAKSELFRNRFLAWFLSALGAFPVQRGFGDQDTIRTANELLARGEIVLIFPEGTRTRPGPLGKPKRGVGRLALESGAPVIPLAIFGTEDVRKGLLLRPRKIRVRAGRALRFPQVEPASPVLAQAVVDRVWPCVSLQWEWLGGTPAGEQQAERPELARVA
jgi:glycerol-3-phosphate dehydrogenase (NAD(P)+)